MCIYQPPVDTHTTQHESKVSHYPQATNDYLPRDLCCAHTRAPGVYVVVTLQVVPHESRGTLVIIFEGPFATMRPEVTGLEKKNFSHNTVEK